MYNFFSQKNYLVCSWHILWEGIFFKQVMSKGICCCNFKYWWRFRSCSCCHHSWEAVRVHRAASSCMWRFFGLSAGHHGWKLLSMFSPGEKSQGLQVTHSSWWAAFVTFTSNFSSSSNKPRILFLQITGTSECRLVVVGNVLLSLSPTVFWYL